MNEFDLIKKYFHQHTQSKTVFVENGDDCAVVSAPLGKQIAMSMDTLVADIHFDKHFSPQDIGYKSLAVNLSDLAAVGAKPEWVMLSLTLPSNNENFIQEFQSGFFEHFKIYPMTLIGGDLTHGPLSITIQVSGLLPTGSALLRLGAKPGDQIYVTHEIGDAALALQYLRKKISLSDVDAKKIMHRLHRPTPRIEAGIILRDIATSAIDISDGLFGDLQHILEASHVGAKIFVDQIPVSSVLAQQSPSLRRELTLYGGDDYELCFTVPKNVALPALPYKITCIGEITASSEIILLDDAKNNIVVSGKSYQHFTSARDEITDR